MKYLTVSLVIIFAFVLLFSPVHVDTSSKVEPTSLAILAPMTSYSSPSVAQVELAPARMLANTDGYADWQELRERSSAVIIVSDGEKAARVALREGQSVDLPLRVSTKLTLHKVSERGVMLQANLESANVDLLGEHSFEGGRIVIFVAEIELTKDV